MLKMCSQLMADSISTVRHQLDNLRSYVMPPVDGKTYSKNYFLIYF